MKLARGVRMGPLQSQVVAALALAETLWRSLGATDVMVTSLGYGTHSGRSRHYSGTAFDLRVQDPEADAGRGKCSLPGGLAAGPLASAELAVILGPDWDVRFDKNHVHGEWAPWPPNLDDEAWEMKLKELEMRRDMLRAAR